MKDVTLADQVEAVHALAQTVEELNRGTAQDGDASRIPAPDLDKVCMIGWSYGGFLSALAVLDAPDVVKAACAGAPPTDWTLYDTHYTERYLGLDPAAYERNSIIADAPKLARPLMLIHGFADDNVTIAHSLRFSQALMAAGRPHTFLPLTGRPFQGGMERHPAPKCGKCDIGGACAQYVRYRVRHMGGSCPHMTSAVRCGRIQLSRLGIYSH